jgi:dTDP-4-dehydrorhamnose reductase
MKVLVLGSTGLLGQAIGQELLARGYELRGAARRNAPVTVDVTDDAMLAAIIDAEKPSMIVNCAALADIDACEMDADLAWRTNARPLTRLAEWSRATGGSLIHVSTDHYFVDRGPYGHDEQAPVTLVNEYARSKFAGEAIALTAPQALVLRTNIVGIRGWKQPTFAEWAIDVVINDRPATLFADVYASSIDVRAFASAVIDLKMAGATGLFNLAAGEIFSKEDFIRELARQLGYNVTAAHSGSNIKHATRRANSLGLDVSRAEAILGYRMPSLEKVTASVVRQYQELSAP